MIRQQLEQHKWCCVMSATMPSGSTPFGTARVTFRFLRAMFALSLAVHLVIQQTVAIVSGVTFRWWWSLMICSEETCGPFLKSCQICIFGLSGGEPLGGADGGGQGRTPSALYLCVWMSNSFPLAFRCTTEPQVRAKTIRMVSFWR